MPTFDEIKTAKEMKELLVLQMGKSLFNLDSTRKILKENSALPAVGVPYVLIETGTLRDLNRIFNEEVTDLQTDPTTFQRDQIKYYEQDVVLTVSSNEPEDLLTEFKELRYDSEWCHPYFKDKGFSILEMGDIVPDNLPTDGGDYEIRGTMSLTVRYYAKRTTIINSIASIEFKVTNLSEGHDPMESEGSVSL